MNYLFFVTYNAGDAKLDRFFFFHQLVLKCTFGAVISQLLFVLVWLFNLMGERKISQRQ